MMPANVPDVLIQGMPMFGGALMMVLGAIVAGNGYGWGTWKTVFTQGPSRPRSSWARWSPPLHRGRRGRAGDAGAELRAVAC